MDVYEVDISTEHHNLTAVVIAANEARVRELLSCAIVGIKWIGIASTNAQERIVAWESL